MSNLKRPSFQFYPGDAEKEKGLRISSLEARGLMFELLMVMHSCEPYGHLAVAGRALDDAKAAALTCTTLEEYQRCIQELLANGVLSRTEDGAIYCRRMVRDEISRNLRATNGDIAGNIGALIGATNQLIGSSQPNKRLLSGSSPTNDATNNRGGITRRLLQAMLATFGGCMECGSENELDLHRIVSGRRGGKYEAGNVLLLCKTHRQNMRDGRLFPNDVITKWQAPTTGDVAPIRVAQMSPADQPAPAETVHAAPTNSTPTANELIPSLVGPLIPSLVQSLIPSLVGPLIPSLIPPSSSSSVTNYNPLTPPDGGVGSPNPPPTGGDVAAQSRTSPDTPPAEPKPPGAPRAERPRDRHRTAPKPREGERRRRPRDGPSHAPPGAELPDSGDTPDAAQQAAQHAAIADAVASVPDANARSVIGQYLLDENVPPAKWPRVVARFAKWCDGQGTTGGVPVSWNAVAVGVSELLDGNPEGWRITPSVLLAFVEEAERRNRAVSNGEEQPPENAGADALRALAIRGAREGNADWMEYSRENGIDFSEEEVA